MTRCECIEHEYCCCCRVYIFIKWFYFCDLSRTTVRRQHSRQYCTIYFHYHISVSLQLVHHQYHHSLYFIGIIIIILTILILLVNQNKSKNFLWHHSYYSRSGPFHSISGSHYMYLQPPFRSNTKRERNDKCLTGTMEDHCHKITVSFENTFYRNSTTAQGCKV